MTGSGAGGGSIARDLSAAGREVLVDVVHRDEVARAITVLSLRLARRVLAP